MNLHSVLEMSTSADADHSRKVKAAADSIRTMLPIESEAISHLESSLSQADYHSGYDSQYKRIPIDAVLSARKKFGSMVLPTFAMYAAFNSRPFEVAYCIVHTGNGTASRHSLATEGYVGGSRVRLQNGKLALLSTSRAEFTPTSVIGSHYNDIKVRSTLEELRSAFFDRDGYTVYGIAHKFTGAIPAEARDLIRRSVMSTRFEGTTRADLDRMDRSEADARAQGLFKSDEIFLIEEAHSYTVGKVKVKNERDPDPLIVGLYNGNAYLLGKFDVTPLENFIAQELAA